MRKIVPKKVKGFRDLGPEDNHLRWWIINKSSQVYKSYGFEHWDTPIIEYAECLGKFLPESQTIGEGVYSFLNPEKEPAYQKNGKEMRDKWNRNVMENRLVMMRYDLTAPLARVYAERYWVNHLRGQLNETKEPLFRRYQYGPVFRFETKLDPGRYREFWQLDFDSVGTSNSATDAEVCMILADAMEAVGLSRNNYIVKLNNRKILKGLLSSLDIYEEALEQSILRIIDKTEKITLEGVANELGGGRTDKSGAFIPGLQLEGNKIKTIMDFLEGFSKNGKRLEVLKKLEFIKELGSIGQDGITELQSIDKILTNLGFDENRIVIDPTLIRGMSYYTGPIFEVESTQVYRDKHGKERKVGSICGGGRYDDLVKNILGLKIPATGASIGVDRLAELLKLTKQIQAKISGPVLIVVFDNQLMNEYQKIARQLRGKGIETEIYYGHQRGLKKQLAYADQKKCPIAILLGEDELKKETVTIRDMRLGSTIASKIKDKDQWKEKVQIEVKRSELVNKIIKIRESYA